MFYSLFSAFEYLLQKKTLYKFDITLHYKDALFNVKVDVKAD